MKTSAFTAFIVSGVLLLFGGGLVVFQVLSGANPQDWFARIFVTGAAALFTSSGLLLLLKRSGWHPWQKSAAVGINAAATLFACWLIVNAIWPH
jgi:hypothetical protein